MRPILFRPCYLRCNISLGQVGNSIKHCVLSGITASVCSFFNSEIICFVSAITPTLRVGIHFCAFFSSRPLGFAGSYIGYGTNYEELRVVIPFKVNAYWTYIVNDPIEGPVVVHTLSSSTIIRWAPHTLFGRCYLTSRISDVGRHIISCLSQPLHQLSRYCRSDCRNAVLPDCVRCGGLVPHVASSP